MWLSWLFATYIYFNGDLSLRAEALYHWSHVSCDHFRHRMPPVNAVCVFFLLIIIF